MILHGVMEIKVGHEKLIKTGCTIRVCNNNYLISNVNQNATSYKLQ